MQNPTYQELESFLKKTLADEYPDDYVEVGENWELLARIFLQAGAMSERSTQTSSKEPVAYLVGLPDGSVDMRVANKMQIPDGFCLPLYAAAALEQYEVPGSA